MIRILVLDDHALFRESLGRLLAAEPDFDVVGYCGSVEEALELARVHAPDVVLLDYDLGAEHGTRFLAEAAAANFQGKILLVTAGMSDAICVQVLREGASGIFLKHGSPDLLIEAIRKVAAGERWVDQACLSALITAAGAVQPANPAESFTGRERSVLHGVFEGMSNKEIAAKLEISESSVKASLQQLFQKTGARSRSQLVRIALEEYGEELRAGGVD
jgi:two-component system nitrate/nitrite response regulator NarL